jgi:RND family efflux transporter MFP subunit
MTNQTMQATPSTVRISGKIVAILASCAGLVLLLMVLAGVFHRKIPVESTKGPQSDLSNANLAEVRVIRKPRYETAVGTIRAVHEAAVASRLLARVVELNIKAGQAVSQGDVLARLDDADLQARFKQTEAALAAAKTNYDQAQVEYERAARLVKKQSIAQEEYERALARSRTTQFELRRSEQAVDESKALLAYATVRAPLTGIVIDKKVEVGDTVVPGQALLTLFNPGKMQMLASVRESLALKLKVGQKIPGRIESLEHECEATISEIVPEAQAASRSFTVKVVGPCPPGVYSGMFGRIYIPLEDEEITVAPADAIRRVGQLEIVQVVEDGKLRRRNVQTGRTIGSDVEILSGLRPGERVALPTKEVRP